MNKKGLIIGIVAFVLLIVGASVLYSKLSKDNNPNGDKQGDFYYKAREV